MKAQQAGAREIRLREMSKADMPRIMALEQELFPEDAWTPEMFAGEFTQPPSRRLYLVAEEGDALIGYAGMMFTGGSQADVVTLAVDPAHWGQGTGTALLSALVDEAGGRGYTEIGIRRGYYQPAGVDAVVMRKVLAR